MAETLQISECQNFGFATVMSRKNADVAAIGGALQVNMPAGPTCVAGHGAVLIGTGPGNWLAFAEGKALTLADELTLRLPGVSVSDQSGGYVIFRIAGPAARRLLQRGAFIDLDPSTFNIGSAATTVMAHISVVIWQIDDAETFHVAVFRSLAGSLRDFMQSASQSMNASFGTTAARG
ncbi:MAG: sarcosine oxidase subunit gamma family protein [Pseudorhodoplanes sp.]